jgi:hypothetical protein
VTHEVGFLTVKSAYISLLHSIQLAELDTAKVTTLKLLWVNNIQSKVSIFGWMEVVG